MSIVSDGYFAGISGLIADGLLTEAELITLTTSAAPPFGGSSLSGVIQRYTTGLYLVKRHARGTRIDGFYVPSVEVDLAVTAVDSDLDQLTIPAHGLATGQGPLYFAADTPPGGLYLLVPYYVVVIDTDHIQLSPSAAEALAFTAIDILSEGVNVARISTNLVQLMSIQPAQMSLDDQPFGQRMDDHRKFWSIPPLYGRDGRNGGFDPDIVVIDDEEWRVETVDFYAIRGQFYSGTLTKLESP